MPGMYERFCQEYEAFSPRSRGRAMAARGVFPGGDTRSSAHFAYPLSIEQAEVSLAPVMELAGDPAAPNSLPIDESFPPSVLTDTVVCPYNEPELARNLIDTHADELAAVIVEPVLGSMGMVPATHEFLKVLRESTLKHGIVLIFDEVITLRLGDLGAQQHHGLTPELTAMGKIIGGGLPIGCIGGKQELMQRFHPDQPRPVMHASTFSGNPISMAAGFAALQHFGPEQRAYIDGLGSRLRDGFNKAFQKTGVRGQAIGLGSLSNIHLTDEPIPNARVTLAASRLAGRALRCIHLGMLMRGVVSAARLMYCTSTAMTEKDVDMAAAALKETLLDMRDDLRREKPELLV